MTDPPQDILERHIDLAELSQLLARFAKRPESRAVDYTKVEWFVGQLAADRLSVAEFVAQANKFTVPASDEFAGDEHPLEDVTPELVTSKWSEIIKLMPDGDRLNALVVLCGGSGMAFGTVSAPVFLALVVSVLLFRSVHEMVT